MSLLELLDGDHNVIIGLKNDGLSSDGQPVRDYVGNWLFQCRNLNWTRLNQKVSHRSCEDTVILPPPPHTKKGGGGGGGTSKVL